MTKLPLKIGFLSDFVVVLQRRGSSGLGIGQRQLSTWKKKKKKGQALVTNADKANKQKNSKKNSHLGFTKPKRISAMACPPSRAGR